MLSCVFSTFALPVRACLVLAPPCFARALPCHTFIQNVYFYICTPLFLLLACALPLAPTHLAACSAASAVCSRRVLVCLRGVDGDSQNRDPSDRRGHTMDVRRGLVRLHCWWHAARSATEPPCGGGRSRRCFRRPGCLQGKSHTRPGRAHAINVIHTCVGCGVRSCCCSSRCAAG